MNAAVPTSTHASFPVPEFGHSADAMVVARIGDAAYAMIPKAKGGHFLGSGWRLTKPLSDWKRSDFYGHGGFHLAADRNARVHPLLREPGGWYEEDAAWAAVAVAWPDLFTGFERRQAEETLRHSWPDAWEAIHGRKLKSGESHVRDGEAFARDHAENWVVISAIYSDHQPGFTEVIATRGGLRETKSEERRFLVPSGDYKVGRFGFVINEACHAVYDGPSSFIGWRGRAGR